MKLHLTINKCKALLRVQFKIKIPFIAISPFQFNSSMFSHSVNHRYNETSNMHVRNDHMNIHS